MTGKLPANEKRPVLPAPSATRNVLPARNRKSSTPVPPRADIIL
nr:MAG TPA: hypothetical protein [Caudoviricetes sp.]